MQTNSSHGSSWAAGFSPLLLVASSSSGESPPFVGGAGIAVLADFSSDTSLAATAPPLDAASATGALRDCSFAGSESRWVDAAEGLGALSKSAPSWGSTAISSCGGPSSARAGGGLLRRISSARLSRDCAWLIAVAALFGGRVGGAFLAGLEASCWASCWAACGASAFGGGLVGIGQGAAFTGHSFAGAA